MWLGEGAGEGGRLYSDYDEAQRDGFFSIWRQVLVGEVANHPGHMLDEVLHLVIVGFYGVAAAF